MEARDDVRNSEVAAYVMMVLAVLTGWASLLTFVAFVFLGSLNLVDLALGESAVLGWDALLCMAFFLQHSGMIRRSFRQRFSRFIPSYYHGATYTVASGVVLLGLIVLWQESGHTLLAVQGSLRWLLRGVYFTAVTGFVWGLLALRSFDTFGVGPILTQVRGTTPHPTHSVIRGPYRWVRHPLYFFMLLLIRSYPTLTADRLLFNLLWTAWVVVGTILEERDLVAEFGEAYREYKHKVPMLIPYRIPTG